MERIVRTEQERVTVTKHPLDDDAFKRHGHREDAAAGRPDAGRVDAHESPLAHGGRKTVARYSEDAEFLPGIRLGEHDRPGRLPYAVLHAIGIVIRQGNAPSKRRGGGFRLHIAPVFSAEIDGALALLEPVGVHPAHFKQNQKPAWRHCAALFGFGNGRLLDTKHVRQFLLRARTGYALKPAENFVKGTGVHWGCLLVRRSGPTP